MRKRLRGLTGGWRQRDRKVSDVKLGDLPGIETEFMNRKGPKSRPGRSQSAHKSEEVP